MSDLLYEVTDHVGVITLNRPDAMNSLTYQLYADLEDTVRTSEARVLVITGSGRAFCAGDDMKQILGSSEPAIGRKKLVGSPQQRMRCCTPIFR